MESIGSLFKPAGIAACALAMSMAGQADAAIINTIDGFYGPADFNIAAPPPATITQTGVELDGVPGAPLGDTRKITLNSVEDSGLMEGTLVVINGSGVMGFAANFDSMASLDLTYDDFSDVDITDGGNDAFAVIVPWLDGAANITVTVNDGASVASAMTAIAGSGTFATAIVLFNDLAGVDLTSVDSIMLSVDTTSDGFEAVFDEFRFATVPEPASLALLSLGGLMLWRRR